MIFVYKHNLKENIQPLWYEKYNLNVNLVFYPMKQEIKMIKVTSNTFFNENCILALICEEKKSYFVVQYVDLIYKIK